MATDQELLAQFVTNEDDEGFIDAIKNDTIKSLRAAGMMVGLYKPESDEEAKALRRRFAADAALLAASTLTGGAAGVALKGVKPIARAILGGALTGGAGTAAFAAVEGEDVAGGALAGTLMGAGFGALGHGASRVLKGAATKAATFEADALAQRRKQFQARTAGEVLGARPGALDTARLRLNELYEQPVDARVRALGGVPPMDRVAPAQPIAAAMQAVDPFEMPAPVRGPAAQRALDPHSMPLNIDDELLNERSWAAQPGEGTLGMLARGTTELPPGERLTITAATKVGPKRPRDARGRFTTQSIVQGIAAHTPDLGTSKDMNQEAARIARQAFIEFVGGEESGVVRGPGASPRSPRARPHRRPRRDRVTPASVENSVAEFLNMGAPEEIVNVAVANSVARRTLVKAGEAVERVAQRTIGADINIATHLEKVYNDSANLLRRVFIPVESALARMGKHGNELGTRMSTALDRAMRLAGEDVEAIRGLRRLSLAERRNVAHVLNGSDVPLNERVSEMAKLVRDRLDHIGNEAGAVSLRVLQPRTGAKRPFALRENYFPYEYSAKTIKKYLSPGPERENALKMIMRSEQGISRKEAEALLRRYLSPHTSEFRYGHLQIARDMALPGWEEDPLKVLPAYFLRGWKRIETAREFGPKDELAKQLFKNMAREGYDHRYAIDAYRAFADKAPVALSELAGITRTMNMYSLLSTTGIVQFAQHSNIIALTGWKNYLQGLTVALGIVKQSGQDPVKWAARTGSYMQELMQDIVPFGSRGMGSFWARAIGLEPLDKANRIVAALAGAIHADDVAAKYAVATDPKILATLERQLLKLKLAPDVVKAANGILTPEQRLVAGQALSLATQFRGSVLDLPLAKNTAAGQFIYLFKNFAFQQTRFVYNLMGEARKGNYAPLIRYLAATGTLTAGTGAAISYLKYDIPFVHLAPTENKPDREEVMRYLEFMAQAGALGIASDGLRGMASGPEMLRSFMLGPTFNDAIGLIGRDVPELARGNPNQILHDTLKHIPMFGRRVANWLAPLEE